MSRIDEGFTQKEMLIRILDKLDKMECKIESTHAMACATNGKVKMNTKAIYTLAGGVLTLTGWFIYHLVGSIH